MRWLLAVWLIGFLIAWGNVRGCFWLVRNDRMTAVRHGIVPSEAEEIRGMPLLVAAVTFFIWPRMIFETIKSGYCPIGSDWRLW